PQECTAHPVCATGGVPPRAARRARGPGRARLRRVAPDHLQVAPPLGRGRDPLVAAAPLADAPPAPLPPADPQTPAPTLVEPAHRAAHGAAALERRSRAAPAGARAAAAGRAAAPDRT